MTNEDVTIIDTVSADTLVPGDQIIIQGDLLIIRTVDSDREDIDEVLIKGENLTNPDEDEFAVFADEYFQVWSL